MLRIRTGWCMRHAKSAVLLTNSALGKAAVLAARFPRATPFAGAEAKKSHRVSVRDVPSTTALQTTRLKRAAATHD